MRLAIWDYAPAELLVYGFREEDESPFDVVRTEPWDARDALLTGEVDVALLPTIEVLLDPKAVDVMPSVALSTWTYPYARLLAGSGLHEGLSRVFFDPRYEQERLVTQIVLKEHYRMMPTFVEASGDEGTLDAADARLYVGASVPTMAFDGYAMDVGQEWYELANYPMVWGLFAMRKGEATPHAIKALRDGAAASEAARAAWVRAQETTPRLHAFYREDLRIRLDDLAIASLTEYKQYLFYHEILDDLVEIPFAFLDEDEEEGSGRRPLV